MLKAQLTWCSAPGTNKITVEKVNGPEDSLVVGILSSFFTVKSESVRMPKQSENRIRQSAHKQTNQQQARKTVGRMSSRAPVPHRVRAIEIRSVVEVDFRTRAILRDDTRASGQPTSPAGIALNRHLSCSSSWAVLPGDGVLFACRAACTRSPTGQQPPLRSLGTVRARRTSKPKRTALVTPLSAG